MKRVLLLIAVIFFMTASFAQMNDVTLTVIGTGETEEIATQNALRKALEEAYGAFLVSRTSIVMDELYSDEIVVNTNGQIKEIKHNGISTLPNGQISVSVTATVSMQKLISYVQGKGCEVAFMGHAFAANLKMMQLKVDNATKTLRILTEQIEDLSEGIFNFEFSMGASPVCINLDDKQYYVFKGQLNVYSNYASHSIYNLFHNTISALYLNSSELDFFYKNQLPYSYFEDSYFEDCYIPILPDTLNYYLKKIKNSNYNALTRVEVQEIGKNKTHNYIWNSLNYDNELYKELSFPGKKFKMHEFHSPIRKSLTKKELKLVKKNKYKGTLCTDSVVYMESLITRIVFPLYIPKESMETFQGFKLSGKQVFTPSNVLTGDNPQFLKIMRNYIKHSKLKGYGEGYGPFYRAEKEIYSRMPFQLKDISSDEMKDYRSIPGYNRDQEELLYYKEYFKDGKMISEMDKMIFEMDKLYTRTPVSQQSSGYVHPTPQRSFSYDKPTFTYELKSDYGHYLCSACYLLNDIDTSSLISLRIRIDGHKPDVWIGGYHYDRLYIERYYDIWGNEHRYSQIKMQ